MRRVFFSFHYEKDNWRAAIVRNSQRFPVKGAAGRFSDAADWESIKRQGRGAISRWIDGQLQGTSVTVVLIGTETSSRPWVQYEIRKSIQLRKGLLGVRIHAIKHWDGSTGWAGVNPLPHEYAVYDWYGDDGHKNLSTWIERAGQAAGR